MNDSKLKLFMENKNTTSTNPQDAESDKAAEETNTLVTTPSPKKQAASEEREGTRSYGLYFLLALLLAAISIGIAVRSLLMNRTKPLPTKKTAFAMIEMPNTLKCKGEQCSELLQDNDLQLSVRTTHRFAKEEGTAAIGDAAVDIQIGIKIFNANLTCSSISIKGEKQLVEKQRNLKFEQYKQTDIYHTIEYKKRPFSFYHLDRFIQVTLTCNYPVQEISNTFYMDLESFNANNLPYGESHWVTERHYSYYAGLMGSGKTYISSQQSFLGVHKVGGNFESHNSRYVNPLRMAVAPLTNKDDAGYSKFDLDGVILRAGCVRTVWESIDEHDNPTKPSPAQQLCIQSIKEADKHKEILSKVSKPQDFERLDVNQALDVIDMQSTYILFVVHLPSRLNHGTEDTDPIFTIISKLNANVLVILNRVNYTSPAGNSEALKINEYSKTPFLFYDCGTAAPEHASMCELDNRLTSLEITNVVLRGAHNWLNNELGLVMPWLFKPENAKDLAIVIELRKKYLAAKARNQLPQ